MVNILDIELDETQIPWVNREGQAALTDKEDDLLATIFEGQKHLIEKYEPIEQANGAITVPKDLYGDLDNRFVQYRIKDLSSRMVEELYEAMNCLKLKPWKNTFVHTDRDHFYEEISDALHFFIELCTTAGLDAETLFKLYFRKHAVNRFRQDSNY